MGRIVIVEDRATGKIRQIDRSLPTPVKSNKPLTFSFVPIQNSVFTKPIRRDIWNSSHHDAPRTWKYWYKHAARQYDRPDLMKRSKRFITPPIRPLYEKGFCIYPHINHF
ncbi:MAG: hypothetical protein EHM49_00590 [Deltaproteobacteria bacterium]|nr:MAG: hypothetical protein EHM49_00590 [Deltaproteobacteria bacterium]